MGTRINFARTTVTETGYYARVNLYPVRRVSHKRGAKAIPTSAVQATLNQRNAEKKLADYLHLNFTPADVEVGLDYEWTVMPEDFKETQRRMTNFLRRLKRSWSKATGKPATEFKYIVVTECPASGRWHHHCAFSGGLSVYEIIELWEYGRTELDPLKFDESGLCGLAHYITKSRTSYRRWSASRNLKKPAPRSSDSKISLKKLRYINAHPDDVNEIERLFPGWTVAPRGVYTAAIKDESSPEVNSVPSMPFVEIKLYRKDCPYFKRYADGRIKYHFGASLLGEHRAEDML